MTFNKGLLPSLCGWGHCMLDKPFSRVRRGTRHRYTTMEYTRSTSPSTRLPSMPETLSDGLYDLVVTRSYKPSVQSNQAQGEVYGREILVSLSESEQRVRAIHPSLLPSAFPLFYSLYRLESSLLSYKIIISPHRTSFLLLYMQCAHRTLLIVSIVNLNHQ